MTYKAETINLKPVSLYIHWPFCKAKCPYCDFNSHVRERIDEDAFVAALLAELDHTIERISVGGSRQLLSIFFGGGTPSLMSGGAVEKILAHVHKIFGSDDSIEITLEANPTSVEAQKFRDFRAAGINRVSLGVQSLKPESLSFLGREHSAGEALKAVELAASIFPRYSFDLIYALPGQTLDSWQEELTEALTYVGDHMSLYQLTIEERTAFYHAYHQQKAFELPVDDLAADLYSLTQDIMEKRGLPAYEISNHAKPGFESQHNLSYWLGREYIGIGPGAHGRVCLTSPRSPTAHAWDTASRADGSFGLLASPTQLREEQEARSIDRVSHEHAEHRSMCETEVEHGSIQNTQATSTLKSPERWLEAVQKQGHGLEECAALSSQQYAEERLMMRLRLTNHIAWSELPRKPAEKLLKMLEQQQLITLAHDGFQLTQKGLLLQQSIVSEMISQLQ